MDGCRWLDAAIEQVKNDDFADTGFDPEADERGSLPSEDFFEMLMDVQSKGLDAQRAMAPGAKAEDTPVASSKSKSTRGTPPLMRDILELTTIFPFYEVVPVPRCVLSYNFRVILADVVHTHY